MMAQVLRVLLPTWETCMESPVSSFTHGAVPAMAGIWGRVSVTAYVFCLSHESKDSVFGHCFLMERGIKIEHHMPCRSREHSATKQRKMRLSESTKLLTANHLWLLSGEIVP